MTSLVEKLRHTADHGIFDACEKDMLPDFEVAADTMQELIDALQLWLDYDNQDEADFANIGPMLLYANAIDATRDVMAKAKAVQS